jgi:7,8-dihydropterin-6-yl-methyl-4-(beta-D-ribofuranosyl)aminobenzene 5'-phosphate synthase
MRIVSLVENLVYKRNLQAEHGFSLFIESGDKKILFDTGQTGLFIQNANELKIDIEEIDFLILSHGHYDHTGGLYHFLAKNSKAKVYAKKEIFIPKFDKHKHFIGTPQYDHLLRNRVIYPDSVTEISENIFLFPDINIVHPIDFHNEGLKVENYGQIVTDQFEDELFLVLKQNNKLNIVTACSHRGITNICETAINYFKLPLNLILGGFHTRASSDELYMHIKNYFAWLKPETIGVSHCTGVEKYAQFKYDLQLTEVFYNHTGHEIVI